MNSYDLEKLCEQSGLEFSSISLHQKRISRFVHETRSHDTVMCFDIEETCRIDNGGVVKLTPQQSEILSKHSLKNRISSFVPAAGASSRYYKDLNKLTSLVKDGSDEDITKERTSLINVGVLDIALLPEIKDFIENGKNKGAYLNAVALPKALQALGSPGNTFLNQKITENKAYTFIDEDVFVVKPEFKASFEQETDAIKDRKIVFTDQGRKLSTCRFNQDGTPIIESDGLSVVPAGHGTLVNILSDLKKKDLNRDAVFIRNIDNTPDVDEANRVATQDVALYFDFVLQIVKNIRQEIGKNDWEEAARYGEQILQFHDKSTPLNCEEVLAEVMRSIFHRPDAVCTTDRESLRKCYSDPVNVLGQVANTGKDIGGSPAFVKTPAGPCKLCIELPHVTADDRKKFIENPKMMTHFNPVFVFSELTENKAQYLDEDSPFWIIVKKPYQGTECLYHESVLYELLGNSLLANPIFIEIPRTLFQPNKSLQDNKRLISP